MKSLYACLECFALPGSPLLLQIDYAYAMPFQVAKTLGSHRVGMTLGWNAKPASTLPQRTEPAVAVYRTPEQSIRLAAIKPVTFGLGKSEVLPLSDESMRTLAKAMRFHADWSLRIEGHTCTLGSQAYNQQLSEQRALAVKTKLVRQYQADPGRIQTLGCNFSKPIASNATEAGRSKNRRVETILLDGQGKVVEPGGKQTP